VDVHPSHVIATIVWRSGVQHRLWIERPMRGRGGRVTWTDADNVWLRAHYATATREEFQARFPHRTHMAIRKQAITLGLKRPQQGRSKPQGDPWTAEEITLLQAYAQGQLSAVDLQAQLPKRSPDAIESQLRALQLGVQRKPIYYRVIDGVLEDIPEDLHPRMGW
jgi:hypothetical protein